MNSVASYIEDALSATPSSSNEYIADCPQCGKENHFSFNVVRYVGHCWVCGYAPTLAKLIMDMEGIPYHTAYEKAMKLQAGQCELFHQLTVEGALESLGVNVEDKKIQTPVTLPDNAIHISKWDASPARKYLRERSFPASAYAPYDLRYVSSRNGGAPYLYNHIIFPVHNEEGVVSYWCSRYCGTPKLNYSKSYNAAGSKSNLLFGWDVWRSKKRDKLVLVEGPLDAIALGGYGVALLGKSMSNLQAIRLSEVDVPIVICLDSDAQSNAYKLAKRLWDLGNQNVQISTLEGGNDPADLLHLSGGNVASTREKVAQSSSKFEGFPDVYI